MILLPDLAEFDDNLQTKSLSPVTLFPRCMQERVAKITEGESPTEQSAGKLVAENNPRMQTKNKVECDQVPYKFHHI